MARAHQHAAGARSRGDLQAEPPGDVADEPADHGLGRFRGGLTTKVHPACEQGQKPLSVVITAGQRGDSPQFQVVLEHIWAPIKAGASPHLPGQDPGRRGLRLPRRANRAYLRRHVIRCTIPEKADQGRHRQARGCPTAARRPLTPKITRPAKPWNTASTGSKQPRRRHPLRQAGRPLRATVHIAAINEWLIPHF